MTDLSDLRNSGIETARVARGDRLLLLIVRLYAGYDRRKSVDRCAIAPRSGDSSLFCEIALSLVFGTTVSADCVQGARSVVTALAMNRLPMSLKSVR